MENNHRGGESSLCGEERIESLKVNDKSTRRRISNRYEIKRA